MNITQADEPSPNNEKYDPNYKAPLDLGNQQELGQANDESLPPKDGGPGAWLFLFGACVFEIVSWGKSSRSAHECISLLTTLAIGFPYSWGVFRAHLYTNGPFKGVDHVSVTGVMNNVSKSYVRSYWYPLTCFEGSAADLDAIYPLLAQLLPSAQKADSVDGLFHMFCIRTWWSIRKNSTSTEKVYHLHQTSMLTRDIAVATHNLLGTTLWHWCRHVVCTDNQLHVRMVR